MTRDEAVTFIQQTLGFRTDKVAEIRLALQQAQTKLENQEFLPWFLISEISSTSLAIGESRVAVPDDFIREADEEALQWFNSTAEVDEQYVDLEKIDSDSQKAIYQSSTGEPEVYSLDGLYFRIAPIPDDTFTIKLKYYQRDTALTTNITNKWLTYAHDWLIGEAGMRLAPGLRDKAAHGIFASMSAEGRAAAIKSSTAREVSNRRYVMGGVD